MGGLATMASGLYITEAYQFTYAAIFGLAIGKFNNCCKFVKFTPLLFFSMLLGTAFNSRC